MIRVLQVAVVVLSLLAGGCGVLRTASVGQEPWVRQGGPAPASDSESLLMYFEYTRKLAPAELAREHEAVRHLYTGSQSDFTRVRYAMLLSVPGGAASDDAHAIEVLEPLVRNTDAPLHNLAFMLSAQLQEQRRAQGLQQKLEALKALEKNMLEREPRMPRRR